MARWIESSSQDVDDQAEALEGWEQTYEQLGCGRFEGLTSQYVTDDGVLLRERTNRQLREQIVPPPERIVLAVPLAVMPGSKFAGRPLDMQSMVLLPERDEYELIAAGELDLAGVVAPREALLAQLAPEQIDWLDGTHPQSNLTLPLPVADGLRRMLIATLDRAAANPDDDNDDLLVPLLAHALTLAMAGESDACASSIPRRAEARRRVVRRAVDFMRANLRNDVGIPEICNAACASRRSLQYSFEEFLHTTPQTYLRALRLNEARRSLKLNAQQPITHLAEALGFSNASHFTRHYKVMFDELPSETYRRRVTPMPVPAVA